MRKKTSNKGVALIMALSVILLLSVALMKTFENRTVETVHLANSLQRFQSESLSRSVFRAILMTIKTKGLLFVIKNKKQWQGFPIPLNEGQYFQIDAIKPIDQLFNLNRKFDPADSWPAVFLSIVNQYRSKDELAIEYTLEDIFPLLSALNDWTDTDSEPDTEFSYYHEDYLDAVPEFNVKNRGLDRLSEVKLIPLMQELGFSQKELESRFRIFSIENDSNKMFIDVNLADPLEIESFFNQFEGVTQFPNLYDASTYIQEILQNRDEELNENGTDEGFLDPKARFTAPLFDRGSSLWEERLEQAGVELSTAEKELFSAHTKLLSISFSVTTYRVTLNIEAIVEVNYISTTGKTHDIESFNILQFSMQ